MSGYWFSYDKTCKTKGNKVEINSCLSSFLPRRCFPVDKAQRMVKVCKITWFVGCEMTKTAMMVYDSENKRHTLHLILL